MPSALRLLAFGDSLTAGYYRSGAAFEPWAPLLRELLDVEVVDYIGVSGFTSGQLVKSMDEKTIADVCPRMWPGFRYQLARSKYDLVLIMCGTNDLADRTPTPTLIDNIATLHAVAHKAGARTVAMTIPESLSAERVEWLGRARNDANDAIRKWVGQQPQDRVHLVEAALLVPYNQQNGMWEPDGLHMSKAGYEAFGRKLAPWVAPIVRSLKVGESWSAGASVRLVGLKSAAHLNGKVGRLADRAGRDGRLGVLLEEGQPPLSVRRENLELVLEQDKAE